MHKDLLEQAVRLAELDAKKPKAISILYIFKNGATARTTT